MIAHQHATVAVRPLQRVVYLVALALAPVACIGLYLFDPAANDDPYPNCPFFWLTGYYCPGCGSLRAYHQLLRGNPGVALGLNPLTVIAVPAIVYAVASVWLAGYRGRGLPQPRWTNLSGWGLATAVFLFGVVRNVPLHALEWMRP